MPIRLAIVQSHPNQHYVPAYRVLAQDSGLVVRVLYAFGANNHEYFDAGFGRTIQWDVPLFSGYDARALNDAPLPANPNFFNIDSKKLAAELDDFKPDLVWVFGYNVLLSWRAQAWAKKHGVPVFLQWDTNVRDPRSLLTRVLKFPIVRLFLSRIDFCLTISEANESYLSNYGVPKRKLFRSCYPVEVERFNLSTEKRAEARDKLRKELGIAPGATVFGFGGKLIGKKRPADILRALPLIQANANQVCVVFIGDGVMRESLRALAEELGVSALVRFTGFVNQTDMPAKMAGLDALILPSEHEPQGLVVAEALISGATAIVSHVVGCVGETDSLRDGETGLVFRCGDVSELARQMQRLIDDPKLLEYLQRNAKRVAVAGHSPQRILDALRSACRSIGLRSAS